MKNSQLSTINRQTIFKFRYPNNQFLALVRLSILVLAFIFLYNNYILRAEDKEFKKGCRSCHSESIEKWDVSETKHFPYREEKCESCHASEHKKFTADLEKPCLICHDLAAEKIKKAHFSANLSGKNCFGCHYTHASDKKGLLKEQVHVPFGSGMCDVCHEIDAAGKIKAKDGMKKVCFVCHSNLTNKEDKFIHPAYEMMECVSCHNPHTSEYKNLLSKGVSELCFDCHDKTQAKKHPYDVYPSTKIILEKSDKIWFTYSNKVTCVSCHKPHTSNIPFLLKDSTENGKLCYNCHAK